jgi:thioesterase domain-containing protein
MPGIVGDFGHLGLLVRHLPRTQPVFGLGGFGPGAPSEESFAIGSTAATYVEAIREVWPTGPYLLAAYSASAIVAYEVAQQLVAKGGHVALLAMIDAEVPPEIVPVPRWTPSWILGFFKNLPFWIVDDLLASNAADLLVRARSRARLFRAWVGRALSMASGVGHQADVRDRLGMPLLPDHYSRKIEIFVDALRQYRPKPYPGRIVALSARARPLFGNMAHDKGWGAYAQGGVDVRTVAGDHAKVLREPHVRRLAAVLTEVIDAALERPGAGPALGASA